MKNILIKGTIASGKTYHAKQEALNATGLDDFARAVENGRIVYVPLYEGYGYSDFIKGTELCTKDNKLLIKPVDKQFAKLCSRASDDKSNEYAIIIDDIDRTDIATVLGEIVYAIENRGTAVNTQSSEKLTVPENLTIIAVSAVPSMNKLDYAFLRRFEHKEYYSDKKVLEKLIAQGECDPKALEEYDYYEGIIDQYLADDLREQEIYYLLGHGWFIAKTEALVYQSMRYKVIPMLEEYVRNGVLHMNFDELRCITKAAETRTNSVSLLFGTIEKMDKDGVEINEDFGEIISKIKRRIVGGKARGALQEIYRCIFDLTWKSSLLDDSILINKLFLNTEWFRVGCKYSSRFGALLIESEYRDEYPSPTQGGTISLYPGSPVYRFWGKNHCLVNIRDGGTFNLSRKLYKNNQEETTAYIPINELLGSLIYNYYILYKSGIEQMLLHNSEDENLLNIIRIINKDIEEFRNLEGKRDFFEIVRVLFDENRVIILNHRANETVISTINGNTVEATLKGVYKMADNNYKAIMNAMNIRQMILQGPPGTSKTYEARQFLKEQLNLPEGTNKTAVENKLKECQITDEMYSQLREGTLSFDKDFYWDIVQFHPSYGYEDFVRGITVKPVETSADKLKGEIKPIAGAQSIEIEAPSTGIKYETVDKILGKTAKFALKAKESGKDVYLIIDEINRANVSSVFGELIYALEYRNEKIATPYSVDGNNEIEIPDNLYVIGTMNTADKSIGNIDYAVRRRFIFFPMLPDVNVIENSENTAKELAVFLFKKTEELFDDFLNEDYNKDDVQVGHTMFLAQNEEETKLKFVYQVLPILREYYKDGVLINGDGNEIIKYLSQFGRKDCISEKKLYEDLLSEYNSSATEQITDVNN